VSEDLTDSFQVPELRSRGFRFQSSGPQVSGSRAQVHRLQVPELRSTGFRFQSSGPQVSGSRARVHRFQVPELRSTGFRFQSSGPEVSEDLRFRSRGSGSGVCSHSIVSLQVLARKVGKFNLYHG